MLRKLELTNFKSAENLSLSLSSLTILAGLNGSGKSSVLQAIALMKQSYDIDNSCTQLVLDGSILSLGYGADVLYEAAPEDNLALKVITDQGEELAWAGMVETSRDCIPITFTGDVNAVGSLFSGFQFIQANRIVPDKQYRLASSRQRDQGSLGSHGEFTIDFLSRNGDFHVSKGRLYPRGQLKSNVEVERMDSIAPTAVLPDAVSAWLQLLSPGARAIAENVELSSSASLRFEYKGYNSVIRDVAARQHRPSHVGFGLTYSLPIIVACLSAPPGSVLLLENPEAHLHPRGQSALGLLLALCANDGVQIIVETHSDHLLNGIRIASKQDRIKSNAVTSHFFTRNVETGISEVISPVLLSGGRFSEWPAGFFDEWSNALDDLLDLDSSPILSGG